MLRSIEKRVWVFDAEWVADITAGRALYNLASSLSEREVFAEMWRQGGATDEDPTPYLKTVLCRVISISALERRVNQDNSVSLNLLSLPRELDNLAKFDETQIIETFLNAIGKHQPQLIGFNSLNADLRILIQRAVVQNIAAPAFSSRPNKPWEGVDYFARGGNWHIDLKELLCGWGKASCSLHEIATLSGIPGKFSGDGQHVAELWLEGKYADIVYYNEYDAITTYLLWLRVAYFAGLFKKEDYQNEERLVENLLIDLCHEPRYLHLQRYLDQWQRLRKKAASES